MLACNAEMCRPAAQQILLINLRYACNAGRVGGGRELARRLALAQRSYVKAIARQLAVNAFVDKFDLGEYEARLLLLD